MNITGTFTLMVEGEQVTIKRIELEDNTYLYGNSFWYNAYVTLQEPLKESYEGETYRKGNIIGVDTAHSRNFGESEGQKLDDVINQISEIIKEHREEILK